MEIVSDVEENGDLVLALYELGNLFKEGPSSHKPMCVE